MTTPEESNVVRLEATKLHPLQWLQFAVIILTAVYTLGIQASEIRQLQQWRGEHMADVGKITERLEKRIDQMESKEANAEKLDSIRKEQKQQGVWLKLIMRELKISAAVPDE